MAMTASISVSPSTAKVNQEVVATLTISNSGGSTVNVTQIDPIAYQTSAGAGIKAAAPCAVQNSLSGAAGGKTLLPVAASGSITQIISFKFFAPSTNGSTYDVLAFISSDDGSEFAPTAATVTIQAPS